MGYISEIKCPQRLASLPDRLSAFDNLAFCWWPYFIKEANSCKIGRAKRKREDKVEVVFPFAVSSKCGHGRT